MRALLTDKVVIEHWARDVEASIQDGEGAPYYVALDGGVVCVTRRCAIELKKRKEIVGAMSARDVGNGIGWAALKAAAEGQSIGLTFRLESAEIGLWTLHCPEMGCEVLTSNPAREMMLLCSEWTDIVESEAGEDPAL